MKKVFALALALMLAAGMALTAFADGASAYSITVGNNNESISINGKTYSAYKLFDVVYSDDAYVYSLDSDFDDFTYEADGNTLSGSDIIDYLGNLDKDTDVEKLNAFAAAALKYAVDNNIAADSSATASGESAVINLANPGYYLVSGTASANDGHETVTAACALTTAAPSANISVKADAPNVDKRIVDADDTNGLGTAVDVGDDVVFRITSAVPDTNGYKKYKMIFTDTLSANLSYNEDDGNSATAGDGISVSIGGEQLAADDYTFEQNGQVLTITLADVTGYDTGDEIVITYSATLTSGAVSTDYETNTVKLTYSNNPNKSGSGEGEGGEGGEDDSTATTIEHTVYVYDFAVNIDKYATNKSAVSDKTKKLSGAKFVLLNSENKFYALDSEGNVTWVDSLANATIVTTDPTGAANFKGLDSGTYKLRETEAPRGYNGLTEDVTVEIKAGYNSDGTLNTNSTVSSPLSGVNVSVGNSTGSLLPTTGGYGTYGFYIVGGALMLGVVLFMVFRKKASE